MLSCSKCYKQIPKQKELKCYLSMICIRIDYLVHPRHFKLSFSLK